MQFYQQIHDMFLRGQARKQGRPADHYQRQGENDRLIEMAGEANGNAGGEHHPFLRKSSG